MQAGNLFSFQPWIVLKLSQWWTLDVGQIIKIIHSIGWQSFFQSNGSFFSPFNPQRSVVHMFHINKLQAFCSCLMLQVVIWQSFKVTKSFVYMTTLANYNHFVVIHDMLQCCNVVHVMTHRTPPKTCLVPRNSPPHKFPCHLQYILHITCMVIL